MSHCGYFVITLILVTSELLSIGSSMEKKICFNISNQHICYFQPKEALEWKQWDTAWNICQNNSATLPIIENQEVQKKFEEYLGNIRLNTKDIWLGGRQVVTKKEWLWSNNKPFYQPDIISDGDQNPRTQAVIMRTSDSESPSNAILRYVATYSSFTCYYICQYSASRCPADNSTNQNEHHGCLKAFYQWLNLSEATANCNKSGGHLAIFDGDEFLTKATKVSQQMQYSSQYSNCYHIGLHRIDTKSWFWMRSNNENSTMEGNYDNWRDRNNRANGDCLFATAKYHRWEASRCEHGKGFICQTIETHATTTKEGADHQILAPTTADSTSGNSTTATTAENSHTTTAKIPATIKNHNDDSSTTVTSAIGAGVVIVILCIIVILVVIWRNSKSSNNQMVPEQTDSETTKDKKTKENPTTTTTEERSIYADIPLAEKTANDAPEAGQKGTVYASLDFNQGVTYAEQSTLYAVAKNTQNVSGAIYAEPLNATGNGITSARSSLAVKTGPMGDVYALPTTNVTPSSDKMTERPIYANT